MKYCSYLIYALLLALISIPLNGNAVPASDTAGVRACARPQNVKEGDKVAVISPSYFLPLEEVEKAFKVLREWGLNPVAGSNVGKKADGQYAGTMQERLSDLRWALRDTSIKAIICSRGGYGTIHLIDSLRLEEFSATPKWLVGYSDISTLHGLLTRSGVMSIHGAMCGSLANGGTDSTSLLMRNLLFGEVPCYRMPAHPQNIMGRATGKLVGGNLTTFVPNLGTKADATVDDGLILFVEEVGESMHNIERQILVLRRNGVLDRCKGVILGEFTGCGNEFTNDQGQPVSVEEMLRRIFEPYGIPVLCGFQGGHGKVNLPLVMGASVTIEVSEAGSFIGYENF